MKKTLLLLSAITLFLTGNVFAQWVQTSAVPTAQVRSISINGSNILVGSMTGWAFGPSGGVYYSTNGGTTFTKTTVTPNTRVWSVFLAGTSFLVGSDGGGIHLSTNNGASWTNSLAGTSVRAFASDGAGNLFAAGYPNGVWRSTNNGVSWAVLGTPSGNLLSITIVGSNIFVGANSGGIYRSSNGGTTWTQPLIASTSVWSFATIGSTIFANATTGLYSSTDDGLTWTLVSNPGSSWQACPMVAVGTTLLVGTSTGVKRSTDLGVTWTDVNTGLALEVAGLAADNQYAYAGSGGYTLTGAFWRRPLSEMIFASCVNPTIAGSIASSQVSCVSFDPILIESNSPASGETGTMEYKWQKSTTSNSSGFADIAGSNSLTYDPGLLTQTTWYKRLARVTCQTDWTGAVESNVVEMTVDINLCDKTLNLSSVLLEGLYNNAAPGTMRRAYNDLGPAFTDPLVADQITVELHDATNYANIVYTALAVNLSTTGAATIITPAAFNASYFITIKHRNSIETTTATAISFAGLTVNQSFGNPANIFGGNVLSSGGYYLIYGGDVNQSGQLESFDMTPIDNLNSSFGYGLNEDINCDGLVDSRDMTIVDNNNSGFVSSSHP